MIFRSPYPDVAIPEMPLTPFVLQRAEELGDKPALIDGPSGRTLSYRQLAGAIRLAAAGLTERGLQQGDVFGICSPNLPEYAVAFHAVATAGGITTTINPLYTVEELVYQLDDADARYLLTIPQFIDKAREAAAQTEVEEIFVFGEAEGATPFRALLDNDGVVPDVDIDPREDLLVLPYSSGTTGLPKGVMLTHHNVVANVAQCAGVQSDLFQVTEDDTLLGVLPFFHIYGMVVIMNYALHGGGTVVTLPRFDMEQFLQTVQDYGVTYAHLVPPIVLGLAKHPLVDQYDLSTLRLIVSGAAPLGENVAAACEERLGCRVTQGYGLTETSPVTHVNTGDEAAEKLASVGPCIPNTEVQLVDVDTGEPVGPNERGELWIRGPQVMKGYLNEESATAATLDADGWLHTGDVGYADDDGYFYIVDRVKELIKYKGYQVAPAELEAVLLSHPAIVDAAVIPSPDEEAGEVPKAFVVRKGDVSADEVMDHVAEHVAPQKKVRRVEFVDEIPKSASGKILRRVLVEREREQAE